MEDMIFFIVVSSIFGIFFMLCVGIRNAWYYLVDKFVDYIYERIKEKEMGEYIENQFDNSRRKHMP